MNDIIPSDKTPYNPSHTKHCYMCNLWLPFSSFYRTKSNPDGLTYRCIKCSAIYNKSRKKDPDRMRDQRLRREYGITQKQYERMLEDQGGVCKSCGQPEKRKYYGPKRERRGAEGRPMLLHIDHDHKTGDVRGLLCHACNTALGQMEESPERIKKLLLYAEWCETREPSQRLTQLQLLD